MNPAVAKKHILDRLAHGSPIQEILNPPCPKVAAEDPETGEIREIDDPDWVPPDMPTWSTVVEWLRDEAFRQQYEHALKFGGTYLADELMVLKNKMMREPDPRVAGKYKVAMEMIKTSAMWRDSKYSDRTIQEIKNTAPQAPEVVMSKIRQLEKELGLSTGEVVDVQAKVVKPRTPAQIAHTERLRQIGLARKGKPRGKSGTKAGEA